jgi:dihydroxyacetone kinase phosphotransfer subunit
MSRTALVVVSHSRPLAEAAVQLALQMGGAEPPTVLVAAGTADGGIGTDATAIAAAIDEAASAGEVLVLMDLGSAILSTELALELRASDARVLLSPGPFVEGLIAAVVVAATGADVDAVRAETLRALRPKQEQLGSDDEAPPPAPAAPASSAASPDASSFEAIVRNPSGLHARPAAQFVTTAGGFDAEIRVGLADSDAEPVDAASIIEIMALGVRQGDRIRVSAQGADADAALTALRTQIEEGFGEL